VTGEMSGHGCRLIPGPSSFTIIECEQTVLDKYRNQLIGEEWIPRRLLLDQFCQRGDASGFAVKSIPNQPSGIFTGEGRKDNFVSSYSALGTVN
jgi:hypothetical protein